MEEHGSRRGAVARIHEARQSYSGRRTVSLRNILGAFVASVRPLVRAVLCQCLVLDSLRMLRLPCEVDVDFASANTFSIRLQVGQTFVSRFLKILSLHQIQQPLVRLLPNPLGYV